VRVGDPRLQDMGNQPLPNNYPVTGCAAISVGTSLLKCSFSVLTEQLSMTTSMIKNAGKCDGQEISLRGWGCGIHGSSNLLPSPTQGCNSTGVLTILRKLS
jgi:hypothetical protein